MLHQNAISTSIPFEVLCRRLLINKYYKSLEQGIEQSINNAKDEAENIKARALEEAAELREKKEKEYKNRISELDLEVKKKEYAKRENHFCNQERRCRKASRKLKESVS